VSPDEPEAPKDDDEKPEHAFAEDEPTNASRPPVAPGELPPGDLPPDEAFDASDTGRPLSDPNAAPEAAETSETSETGSARMESIVESLLFAADKPLTLAQLGSILGEQDLGKVRAAVATIEEAHATRGIQLHAVGGGYQFRTHPQNATWVQKLLAQKPVRLTRAQLETLAIVAYRQPITRPEIDQIRGVDSGGTLKTLMDRSLVRILGKKEEPGRPMLYGSTKDFLEFFNLNDLKDLPTLREFHELTEEHRAQVAALESAAPEGSIESAEEAALAEAAKKPLERVELHAPPEDAAELEEIDRLIQSAGRDTVEMPAVKPEPGSEPESA
jgi:segregation and condensation protein B